MISKQKTQLDVVIVGGGIAGIAAANQLNQFPHISWALFEADQRIGGRIQSALVDGKNIDTGAYELAGFDSESVEQNNQLYKGIKKGLCELNKREDLNKAYYYDQIGGQFSEEDIKVVDKVMQEFFIEIKALMRVNALSQKEGLDHFMSTKFESLGLTQNQHRLFLLKQHMGEQENAADMQHLLVQQILQGDDIQGDQFEQCQLDSYPIPKHGYHSLLLKIYSELPVNNIALNSRVISISKSQGNQPFPIKVTYESQGQMLEVSCKKVICAVPLKVLQEKRINFEPSLPPNYEHWIQKIKCGIMDKIILAFQEPFWPEDALRLKFSSPDYGKFPHFINLSGPREDTGNAHILGCFITGKYSKQYHAKYSEKELAEEAVKFLKEVFPEKSIVLKDYHVTNWGAKKNIEGSFSSLTKQCQPGEIMKLRKSIDKYLWLVGEYLYVENMGCAHGAYSLGAKSALQIIKQLQP